MALGQDLAGVVGHVGGVPVEEMLGASPGALMLMTGAGAWWRARRHRRAGARAAGRSAA